MTNMTLTKKNGGEVVATFPVTDDHQVMLVSDQGQLIRMPVAGVRFTSRAAQGVTLFKVAKGENVVSVAWLVEDDEAEAEVESEAETETGVVAGGVPEGESDGEKEA